MCVAGYGSLANAAPTVTMAHLEHKERGGNLLQEELANGRDGDIKAVEPQRGLPFLSLLGGETAAEPGGPAV